MKQLIILLLSIGVGFSTLCYSQAADQKEGSSSAQIKPATPEMQKLAGLVGEWKYEGEQASPPVEGLPFGPEGKFQGKTKACFILNGHFLKTEFEDNSPASQTTMLYITRYDSDTRTYIENQFFSDGTTSVTTLSWEGRTRTDHSTLTTTDGKKILIRGTLKYTSDWTRYSGVTEVSPDNGNTWVFWYDEKGEKVMSK
jgi:hypothetical protein